MDLADPVAKEGGEADAEPKTESLAEEKGMNRKEKRKAMKKMKRKQTRKEMALKEREEEEAILNDPQELMKIKLMEQEEAERSERERKLFEERERAEKVGKDGMWRGGPTKGQMGSPDMAVYMPLDLHFSL
ncbi:zinc finger CCCH domain-containing protein 5 isoform X1 [Prunus yedoensis var. nudiflora]|uniref:Zinc finger CCCH domain-containing protein 5 isoform X1 n=1 Tax=Prunus yedoensis var. nudiflora TaxID=2094558 RepID=A0A314YL32_PRUYE|nr:zinc finger CCCH domain-containing protein 5 isoform X1 [Prunus yedoensis var. nudiflora]